MKFAHLVGFSVLISVGLMGCSTAPVVAPVVPQPGPPALTMQISAKVEKNSEGLDCLTFAGVPSDDMIVNKVTIKDPIARSITYIPAGSGQTVAKSNPINLQDAGICYDKRSGPYNFEFSGSRIGGGAVTVNSTYTQQ